MKLYKDLTPRQRELFNRIEGYFISTPRATITDLKHILSLLTYKYTKSRKRS